MTSGTASDERSLGLIRGLGLWASIAVVVGTMIGQSVFLVASDMAREVDSLTKVIVVWIVGGVIVLCGACCYAELGAAMPQAGGDADFSLMWIGSGLPTRAKPQAQRTLHYGPSESHTPSVPASPHSKPIDHDQWLPSSRCIRRAQLLH